MNTQQPTTNETQGAVPIGSGAWLGFWATLKVKWQNWRVRKTGRFDTIKEMQASGLAYIGDMKTNFEPKLVLQNQTKPARVVWGVQTSPDYVAWCGSEGFAKSFLQKVLFAKSSIKFEPKRECSICKGNGFIDVEKYDRVEQEDCKWCGTTGIEPQPPMP